MSAKEMEDVPDAIEPIPDILVERPPERTYDSWYCFIKGCYNENPHTDICGTCNEKARFVNDSDD